MKNPFVWYVPFKIGEFCKILMETWKWLFCILSWKCSMRLCKSTDQLPSVRQPCAVFFSRLHVCSTSPQPCNGSAELRNCVAFQAILMETNVSLLGFSHFPSCVCVCGWCRSLAYASGLLRNSETKSNPGRLVVLHLTHRRHAFTQNI